jgi:hypothetical protein
VHGDALGQSLEHVRQIQDVVRRQDRADDLGVVGGDPIEQQTDRIASEIRTWPWEKNFRLLHQR